MSKRWEDGRPERALEALLEKEPGWLRPYLRTVAEGAPGELRMDRLYKLFHAGLITLARASDPTRRASPDDYAAAITEEGLGLLATEDPRAPRGTESCMNE